MKTKYITASQAIKFLTTKGGEMYLGIMLKVADDLGTAKCLIEPEECELIVDSNYSFIGEYKITLFGHTKDIDNAITRIS